jgi:hypothetical protein
MPKQHMSFLVTAGAAFALIVNPVIGISSAADSAASIARKSAPQDNSSISTSPKIVLLLTDDQVLASEQISRFENLLDGIGIPYEKKYIGGTVDLSPSRYQLIILSPERSIASYYRKNIRNFLERSLEAGSNVLLLGLAICDFDQSTSNLLFGIIPLSSSCTTKNQENGIANLGTDQSQSIQLYNENVKTIIPGKAHIKGFLADGRAVYTEYRLNRFAGKAVTIALPLLDYWKSDQGQKENLYKRPLFVASTIQDLMSQGYVGKHSTSSGKASTFLLRWEDVAPVNHLRFSEEEFGRVNALLQLSRLYKTPLNISVISRYKSPAKSINDGWDADNRENNFLRNTVMRARRQGGTLIVHGYSHQYGTELSDMTAIDSEMSDDAGIVFRPFREQLHVVNQAIQSFRRDWGEIPMIWETPHYQGNPDTYKAVYRAGLRMINESDAWLFPNWHGKGMKFGGKLLNVPETATSFPDEAKDIDTELRAQKAAILPDLHHIGAPYLFFFHLGSRDRLIALARLLRESTKYDFWRPGLLEYFRFWQQRQKAEVTYSPRPSDRVIEARVSNGFPGLTLVVRLPDWTRPSAVMVNGEIASARSLRMGSYWMVYPVIPKSGHSSVRISYSPPDPSLTETGFPVHTSAF